MKPLFNSIGSNYQFGDVVATLSALVGVGTCTAQLEVTEQLKKWFAAKPFYFYKGRDAIEFALRTADIGVGDIVISQAFSCYAIEEAVRRVGATVAYADIDESSCNMSVATISAALKRCAGEGTVKAVLVQHVLGLPAESAAIRTLCKNESLLFIEDLAQGFGAKDSQNVLVGSMADLVILSFGRDKIIDAVSGGACLVPDSSPLLERAKAEYSQIADRNVSQFTIIRELLYPFFTWKVRYLWSCGIGALLLKFFQLSGIFKSPIVADTAMAMPLPSAYFPLLLRQVSTVSARVEQRKQKMQLYVDALKNAKVSMEFSSAFLQRSSGLRFPLLVENPKEVIDHLQKIKIYFSDRWYRSPVDCGTLSCQTTYKQGIAPVAEKMAVRMLNLPTHQGIQTDDIERITAELARIL